MHQITVIVKWLILLAVVAALVFVLLNFNYFSQHLTYFFDQTFVTDAQREFRRNEQRIQQKPNEIYIPALEIRAPIIFTSDTNEAGFQQALQKGVVLYPGTAQVGQVGNTYIFGHSSDFAFAPGEFKTVFALLPNLQIGEQVLVSNENGKIFKYIVYEKFVAEKTATHLLSQDTGGRKVLTLQTSYPIGTALKRYIVRAELLPE